MLITVEGGGFFSASASGYSKFLSLLLFGTKNEEKPMRVSPWSQYHLVGQEVVSTTQLAPKKSTSVGCAFFICCGHPSTCHEETSVPKLGPVIQSKLATEPSSEKITGHTASDGNEANRRRIIKGNIKKTPLACPLTNGNGEEENVELMEAILQKDNGDRKVHWTDTCGRELAEIREFEPSDYGPSDEESDRRCLRKWLCAIQ